MYQSLHRAAVWTSGAYACFSSRACGPTLRRRAGRGAEGLHGSGVHRGAPEIYFHCTDAASARDDAVYERPSEATGLHPDPQCAVSRRACGHRMAGARLWLSQTGRVRRPGWDSRTRATDAGRGYGHAGLGEQFQPVSAVLCHAGRAWRACHFADLYHRAGLRAGVCKRTGCGSGDCAGAKNNGLWRQGVYDPRPGRLSVVGGRIRSVGA